jgi:hypothetical protein
MTILKDWFRQVLESASCMAPTCWYGPKLIEVSIGVIENANYLSFDQKRDILFNNAVRFFRLDESKLR